jgi:hypothetical protein
MELRVVFENTEISLAPGQHLTVGRQADLVVDGANRRLHRVLLRFDHAQTWMVTNVGRSITVVATDADGSSYARLVPGAAMPVPFTDTSFTFSAGTANYRVTSHLPAGPAAGAVPPPDDAVTIERTENPALLDFNAEQLELLSALAKPRLSGPITVADLPSTGELAHELGWSTSKLNRKLDRLCAKLQRGGLQGVSGSSGNDATQRRLVLANFAVESGLVGR